MTRRALMKLAGAAFVPAAAAAGFLFLTGCEEGQGTAALTVTPSYVDLTATSAASNNAVQTFTVTGGLRQLSLPLEWRVSDSALGTIGAVGGDSASYVRKAASGDNSIWVQDQYGAEGVATVHQ